MRLNPTDGAGWRSEEKKFASLSIFLFRTLISKANVANVQVAFDKNRGDLRVTEDVEEMGIALLLVRLDHPPVVITAHPGILDHTTIRVVIAPEQERLVEVDRGAVSRVPGKTHRCVLKNAPTLDQLLDCTLYLFSVKKN